MVTLIHASHPAGAQTLERLFMPGPVIQGHAKFENTCSKCHEPFKKTSQKQLCVKCHKDVNRDIARSRGFHGRIKNIARTRCRSCHTEHKGRKADIVLLDKETFDHTRTDFRRTGAHARVACESCHKPGKKYRDAPGRCVDCHGKVEPHRGRLGKKCANCHVDRNWREVRFDHDRLTKFPLRGKHAKTSCKQCHIGERYKKTPKICYDCHRLNDAHRGRFGTKCDKCHTPSGWKKKNRFDHNRDTHFKLFGRHRTVKCIACHTGTIAEQKRKNKECRSCHASDDVHKGRNGKNCAACHRPEGWKEVKFDHDRQTKFPLRWKHKNLKCEACHKGALKKDKPGRRCADCHRTDDVHKNKLGSNCENCHSERGWSQRVRFEHDLTRFPLIGQHAVVPCEECHASRVFKGTARACVACHANDDAHKKQLGPKCESCHNPNGWAFWRFDHNVQTAFKLDGAHENLKCEACHTRPTSGRVSQSKVCGDCHTRDDVHRGAFSRWCNQCHTTKSFKKLKIRR
jgi:hypothetical protein